MEETPSEASCVFPVSRRRCSCCLRLGPTSDFLRCSKCRCCVYCDKDCQKEHWKRSHKISCKAQETVPPSAQECVLQRYPEDSPDLDVAYKYILLTPLAENSTYEQFLASSSGISEDAELDELMINGCETNTKVTSALTKRYLWKTMPSVSTVPGFKDEYDGNSMFCIADNNHQTCDLPMNNCASYLKMLPLVNARGPFIFSAVNNSVMQDNEDGVQRGSPLLITRRQILSIVNHHQRCGVVNTVSERIHFENISRKEAMLFFKKENFVDAPIDM